MESLKRLVLLLDLPPRIRESLETLLWVRSVWNQIFPDGEIRIWPVNFERGVLIIAVSDHYELQSLQVNYLSILNRFKELFPEPSLFPIKKIKFIYRPKIVEKGKTGERPQVKRRAISKEEWQEVIEACKKTPDPELGTIFQRALQNYIKLI